MFGFKFPYTNMHNLNLDWIINQISDEKSQIGGVETALTAHINEVNSTLDEKIETGNSALDEKIDTVNSTLDGKINTVNSTLDEKIDTVNSDLSSDIAAEHRYAETNLKAVRDDIASLGGGEDPTTQLLERVYPIGSIYMSVESESPASLFGGTWEALENRFLLGAGSEYAAGTSGGASTVALTSAQMPSHNHPVQYSTDGGKNWKNVNLAQDGGTANVNYAAFGTNISSYASARYQIGSTGSGSAHNNMPPYLVVYIWKRINEV